MVHFGAKGHPVVCGFEVTVLQNAYDNCKPSLGVV